MGKMEWPDAAFTYQVLVMPSDEGFSAVALEMDLWGIGESVEEALEALQEHVEMQVSYSVQHGELHLLDRPAPEEYQQIARNLRDAYLRHEESDKSQFVRSLPLPSAGSEEYDAA